MQNREKNSPETNSFDRADMEDVFRVFQNYAAEHSSAIEVAGSEVPYSLNESRGLVCKMALFADDVMQSSEAIDRVVSTVKFLSDQAAVEQDPEKRHQLNYSIMAQINIMGLFSWLEAYGPRVVHLME